MDSNGDTNMLWNYSLVSRWISRTFRIWWLRFLRTLRTGLWHKGYNFLSSFSQFQSDERSHASTKTRAHGVFRRVFLTDFSRTGVWAEPRVINGPAHTPVPECLSLNVNPMLLQHHTWLLCASEIWQLFLNENFSRCGSGTLGGRCFWASSLRAADLLLHLLRLSLTFDPGTKTTE